MKKQQRLLVIILLFVAILGTLGYAGHRKKQLSNSDIGLENKATKNSNFKLCNSSDWVLEKWAVEVTIYEKDFIYQSNYSIINNSSGKAIITGTRVRNEPNFIQKTTQNFGLGEHGHTEYASNKLLSEFEDKVLVAQFKIGVFRNNRLGLVKFTEGNFIRRNYLARVISFEPKKTIAKYNCYQHPESDRSMILETDIVIFPEPIPDFDNDQIPNLYLESLPKGALKFNKGFGLVVTLIDGKTNLNIADADIGQQPVIQDFQTNSVNGTVIIENSDNGHPIPLNHFSFKFRPILKETCSMPN